MYLELSARGTGKTTRLIKSVVNNSIQGIQCIIFSNSEKMRHYIMDQIMNELKSQSKDYQKPKFFITFDEYFDYMIGRNNFIFDRLYYDEFDYFKYPIIISKFGYYVTTTKTGNYSYSEILIELLKENNGKYVSYMNVKDLE